MASLEEIAITAVFPLAGFAAVAFGVAMVYYGVKSYRTNKRMAETETTPVREIEPGVVELKGTARAIEDEEALSAPISGNEALATTATVQKYSSGGKHSSWNTIYDQETVRPFLVDDGTGEVRVEPPEDASLRLRESTTTVDGDEQPPDNVRRFVEAFDGVDPATKDEDRLLASGERRRYREGSIEPGDDVYVFGEAVESEAGWGADAYEVTGGADVGRFVLSDMAEEELTSSGKLGAVLLSAVGLLVLLFGVPFLLVGLLGLGSLLA